ncbi:MAG TPA: hypothetical protein VGT05_03250 [Patescibacteria group bacterium]|nr:hypothetical protein [Patescibacteria group bacterium]
MVTTKDLIKLFVSDVKVRDTLLAEIDTMHGAQAGYIVSMLWNAFSTIYAAKLDENTHEGFVHIAEGSETLDEGFYIRIRQKTDKDFEAMVTQAQETAQLKEARKAMEVIVKEIQASKGAKKITGVN